MGANSGGHIADAGWQVRVIETILVNTFQLFDDDWMIHPFTNFVWCLCCAKVSLLPSHLKKILLDLDAFSSYLLMCIICPSFLIPMCYSFVMPHQWTALYIVLFSWGFTIKCQSTRSFLQWVNFYKLMDKSFKWWCFFFFFFFYCIGGWIDR